LRLGGLGVCRPPGSRDWPAEGVPKRTSPVRTDSRRTIFSRWYASPSHLRPPCQGANDLDLGTDDSEFGTDDLDLGANDLDLGANHPEIGADCPDLGTDDLDLGVEDPGIGVDCSDLGTDHP
jgi:hypothetical protein